jgi:hypothetical protein
MSKKTSKTKVKEETILDTKEETILDTNKENALDTNVFEVIKKWKKIDKNHRKIDIVKIRLLPEIESEIAEITESLFLILKEKDVEFEINETWFTVSVKS